MPGPVMVVYSEKFSAEGYPYLKHRIKPAFQALKELIQRGLVEVIEPTVNDQAVHLLERLHNRQHINDVRYSGHYDVSLLSLAGVVQGAELLAEGKYARGFAFVGAAGHHASPNGFWGFCFFNDVAAAIYHLREKGLKRFLILDVDPHFGDGTRNFFKNDKDVIHILFVCG